MASPRPFHPKEQPTVRRAAFAVSGGPRVRPAFSAEGEPEPEPTAFAGQSHAEASPAFTDGGPADRGPSLTELDGVPLEVAAEHGFDGFDGFDALIHDADAATDAAMNLEAAPAPSRAEAVQVGVPAGAPDEGIRQREQKEALDHLVNALHGAHAALTEEAKSTAVTLGLAIARRVVGEQLTIDAEPLRAFIDDALEKVPAAANVRLFLAPDDVERIEDIESDRWHAPGRKVSVVVDESLTVGDCRLEAPGISMDGRLSTRIERLAQAARTALMLSDEGP
jgi:flagellar biosynthesis/type III secretory pathway protein FliH